MNFDHNATTPLAPQVRDRLRATWEDASLDANPASAHRAGQRARALLEGARRDLAAAIDAEPLGIVWTSGGTEANNLALRGALASRHAKGLDHAVVSSAMEHPCVTQCLHQCLGAHADALHLWPVDGAGRLQDGYLEQVLGDHKVGILTLMLAQHELGNVYEVAKWAALARKICPDIWIHCDAVQALGKLPVSFDQLGVDSMALSAHKFGGPKGVGALVMRRGLELTPQIVGGSQERGFRGGTPSVRLVDAMALAAQLASERQPSARAQHLALYEDLRPRLSGMVGVQVLGDPTHHVGNTLCVSFDKARGEDVMIALDLEGICVSTGAACSVGASTASSAMLAMGLDEDQARRVLRISWGTEQTREQGEQLAQALGRTLNRISSAKGDACV